MMLEMLGVETEEGFEPMEGEYMLDEGKMAKRVVNGEEVKVLQVRTNMGRSFFLKPTESKE